MRVFVTGASGFIGSATTRDLVAAGHTVLGLARSDDAAKIAAAAGAEVLRGGLEDLDVLRRGAAETDGTIHTAFVHDFSNFAECCAIDGRAIEAMGTVLAGSNRPLVVASGTVMVPPGEVATEDTPTPGVFPRVSEQSVFSFTSRGVRSMAMRLPPTVHGVGEKGFVPMLYALAREKGVSAYVEAWGNRWSAVHRTDAAKCFRLAVEKGTAGACYNAVDDEGIPFRTIAEHIGKLLGVPVVNKTPEDAAEHFGGFAMFASMNRTASSAKTRAALGWSPTGPKLLADIADPKYFAAVSGH